MDAPAVVSRTTEVAPAGKRWLAPAIGAAVLAAGVALACMPFGPMCPGDAQCTNPPDCTSIPGPCNTC